MNPISHFTRFDQAREIPLGHAGKTGFTTLIVAGIVNPFGPTLNVIAADGAFDSGGRMPILQMMLNPFTQSCQVVGEVEVGEQWAPVVDLASFFTLSFGACPTLLIPSLYLDSEAAEEFHARFLTEFDDGGAVLAKVRKHPGNPWNRLQEEVSAAGDMLIRRRGGPPVNSGSKRLSLLEAGELARMQLLAENLGAEIAAFLFAWKGAIDFQNESPLSRSAMSYEDFVGLFSELIMTCRIPQMND